MNDDDEISGYYNDDGEKLNPNFISKPDLCTTCRKNDDEKEEMICHLNRLDQAGEKGFICYAYVSKFGDEEEKEKEEDNDNDEEKDEGIKF